MLGEMDDGVDNTNRVARTQTHACTHTKKGVSMCSFIVLNCLAGAIPHPEDVGAMLGPENREDRKSEKHCLLERCQELC